MTRRMGGLSLADKPLLSVEEAATLLGVRRSTLYRAVKAGSLPLPIYRIGATWKIPRRAIEQMLEGSLATAGDLR